MRGLLEGAVRGFGCDVATGMALGLVLALLLGWP